MELKEFISIYKGVWRPGKSQKSKNYRFFGWVVIKKIKNDRRNLD